LNKDKEAQLKGSQAVQKSLETLKNNTDLSPKQWQEALQFRKECVDEYIKYLETGKNDHVNISTKLKQPPVEHFK
jgi:hypothetical protein